MTVVPRYLRTLFVLLALAGAMPAHAGLFSVTPVRIFMTPRDRAVAVTIVNESDAPVVLQADISDWRQVADGGDELTPTEDMILSPPIIRLGAKARQVVRLGRVKPADASRQLTYRMILVEVPEAVQNQTATVEVQVALALSMPVFITPLGARREISCLATHDAELHCSNSGSAYAQIREATLSRGGQVMLRFEGGMYILPGATRKLPAKVEHPVSPGPAQLKVAFDDGKVQIFELVLP